MRVTVFWCFDGHYIDCFAENQVRAGIQPRDNLWGRRKRSHFASVCGKRSKLVRSNNLVFSSVSEGPNSGNEVLAFEKEFASFAGTQFAIAMGNATQGLVH